MRVKAFEEKVWSIEGVRVVLRTDPDVDVSDYSYKKAADEGWRVTELLEKRISKCASGIPTIVLQGDGREPHGNVTLRTIRQGYNA